MSYQSIKRVLGETGLERKCRFLFGACLLVLIGGAFLWCARETENLVLKQNVVQGRLLVGQAMYHEHLMTWENDPKAALLAQKLSDELKKEDFHYSFITPRNQDAPPGPEGWAPNDDERDYDIAVVNSYIEASNDPTRETLPDFSRLLPGGKEYQYYEPIYADAPECVMCHNAKAHTTFGSPPGTLALGGGELGGGTPLSEGDLMAIAKVTIPYAETQEALNTNKAVLLTIAIVCVSLAMIASYVIVRYVIVKPLRHLRDVSDAISQGNISLRAEIHTGDEFESLAVAFNRMLRHLVAIQKELQQVNADLDGKVDELAQVNMRLYELNTIKSDFLATMSHELRTPLNSILGFSDVLGSVDSIDEKQRRYVDNIQSSGRLLLEMINAILDLAKIESGKMETRPADFGIEQIVSAQCDMARPLTEQKNIDLTARFEESKFPPIHQDQVRVQQILNNLLSNAIKFTPEGGRISVSIRRDREENLVMGVSDTGVGIAEEDQQVIFEKFRQGRAGLPGDDAMTRQYAGTGLGLSIVRELCRLLGGEVTVESELGKGSTFTVRLPWTLQPQPRLDSSLVEGFEEFTRPRLDFQHDSVTP